MSFFSEFQYLVNNVASNNKFKTKISEIDIESSPPKKAITSNFTLSTKLQKSYEQPM